MNNIELGVFGETLAEHFLSKKGYQILDRNYRFKKLEVDIIEVGDKYLHTMNLTLMEGRDFIKDSETDQKESIIITEQMAKVFGLDKPIGKELIWMDTVKLYVVGVVKDVYTRGMWRELEPMMIRYVLPDKYSQIVISTRNEKVNKRKII